MQKALTDAFLRGIPAPSKGRAEYADTRCVGLAFRITAAGAKSWTFRFRDPLTGQSSRHGLGRYPDVTLSAARDKADAARKAVAHGTNPVEAKRKARGESGGKTFGALAARYMIEHARRKKRSADADQRNLDLHVLPKWKGRQYSSIRRADAIELIEGMISDGKSTQANRVHALISTVFSFAVDAGLMEANPIARLKKRGVEGIGERTLTAAELKLLWPKLVLKPLSRPVGLALRLALLTAARAGEASGIRRSELAKNSAEWTIPASRSKNGREHVIPLSSMAQETLRSAFELIPADQDIIFPSPVDIGKPITAHALAVGMARLAKSLPDGSTLRADPPSPHDLRRTVATDMASLGIPAEDISAVLNHVRSDVTGRHYDKYARFKEKQRALDAWADHVSRLLGSS